MKTLLNDLKQKKTITIGNCVIFSYEDGEIVVRKDGSGLMSQIEKPTMAGLKRLLDWIDNNN